MHGRRDKEPQRDSITENPVLITLNAYNSDFSGSTSKEFSPSGLGKELEAKSACYHRKRII
jgi:hypothetical protein